jgi:hypothetical protein
MRAATLWVRRLRRDPTLVLFTIVSLGLPLGASVMALSLNLGTLWRPLPFPEPDRLVKIEARTPSVQARWLSLPELHALSRPPAPPFAGVAGYTVADVSVAADGVLPAEGLLATLASADFFSVLGISPAVGRLPEPDMYSASGERVALLGHDLWQRRYAGDPAVVGRVIHLSANDYFRGTTGPYRVVGILPRDLWLFWKRADLVVPMRFDAALAGDVNGGVVEHVLARLRPEADAGAARAAADPLLAQIRSLGAREAAHALAIEPLARAHFRGQQPQLLTVLAMAMLVVALAVTNLAAAGLAEALRRRRDTAIRIALGGSWRRLLGDTLADTSLTVACAGLLSAGVGALLIDAVATLAPDSWLSRVPGGAAAFRIDARAGALIVAVCGAGALAASLAIQRLGRAHAPWTLIASAAWAQPPASSRLRSAIVAIEIALAVASVGIGVGPRRSTGACRRRMDQSGYRGVPDGGLAGGVLRPAARRHPR